MAWHLTSGLRCPSGAPRAADGERRVARRRAPSQASATGSGHWRHSWRCGRLSGAGSRMWLRRRGRAPWAAGGPGGARVSSARPEGCRVSSPVSPDVPPALTRWCVARGGEAVWCAGRRCRLGGAACHAASPVLYRPRVLGQWFEGNHFYATASSPSKSRRTWAALVHNSIEG